MMYNISPDQIIEIMGNPVTVSVIILISIWSLIWKGIALWKASQKGQKTWFIVLLVVNTVGILEILYIFWLNKYCEKWCAAKKEGQLPPVQ